MFVSRLISLLIIFTVLATRPAHAYLDPGTGSLITQALAGFLLAVIFSLKLWTGKIKQFFKKNKTQQQMINRKALDSSFRDPSGFVS